MQRDQPTAAEADDEPAAEPAVLFEDNHLLFLHKPAGMLVQGDRSGDPTLLDWGKDYIQRAYDKPGNVFLGLVHRLDRPVSGVVVFARTSKAARRLGAAFQEKRVTKIYRALVHPAPPETEATLEHGIRPGKGLRKSKIARIGAYGAKEARLRFRVLGTYGAGTLVEVEPETGRKHQIRVQLSAAGAPIVGDTRYGATRRLRARGIALHAHRLTVPHPVGEQPVTVEAPLPGAWEIAS